MKRSGVWHAAAVVTVLIAFGANGHRIAVGYAAGHRQSKGRMVKLAVHIYIEFFRGTPVLVQLLFLYFGLPTVDWLAMPGWLTALDRSGPQLCCVRIAGLSRRPRSDSAGTVGSVLSPGMNPLLAFRRIILPQHFRIALPPMTNDFVSLFKDTSVAYAISVWELATAYRELANASGSSAFGSGRVGLLSGYEFADGACGPPA